MFEFNSEEIPENYCLVSVSNGETVFLAHTDEVSPKIVTQVIGAILLLVPHDKWESIVRNALEKSIELRIGEISH